MAQETTKKKNKVKIVLWSIFGVIFSFLFIMECSLFYQKVIKKSPTPTFLGFGIFHVITGSMNGTAMMEGDLVIIKRSDEYKIGDIVTFMEEKASTPTTHRIVFYDKDLDLFTTCGDANGNSLDKPIKKEQIVGKVIFVISGGGYFFDWLGEENGWVYIVAIIIVVGFVIYMLFRKKDESDESDDSDKEDKLKIDNSNNVESDKTKDVENVNSKETEEKNEKGELV